MIQGMTVQLVIKTVTGADPFGHPIFYEQVVDIDDVLVGQPSADDITSSVELYGKKCEYTLGIPRGDAHDWTDTVVYIRGEKYITLGYPVRGIDENVPLRWNRNIKVARYG